MPNTRLQAKSLDFLQVAHTVYDDKESENCETEYKRKCVTQFEEKCWITPRQK